MPRTKCEAISLPGTTCYVAFGVMILVKNLFRCNYIFFEPNIESRVEYPNFNNRGRREKQGYHDETSLMKSARY